MDFESLAAKLQGNRIRIHIFYCGRKNYMFCCNYESAENMCVIQSLLATCRTTQQVVTDAVICCNYKV